MLLGELRKALEKISPDMDDAYILIQTGHGGKEEYDLLTFVARIPDERFEKYVILGTLEATRVLVKNKKLRVPDDYVPGGEDDITTST